MIVALTFLAAAVRHAALGDVARSLVDFATAAALLARNDRRAARRAKGPAEVRYALRCPECATATLVDADDPDTGFDEAAEHLVTRHGYEWDTATETVSHENGRQR